jgi:integrase
MRPIFISSHSQYGLIKRQLKDGSQWYYVRFWNETEKRWFKTRATGVPADGKRQRLTQADAVAKELLQTVQYTGNTADGNFIEFISSFWLPDSEYLKAKESVNGKPFSALYVLQNGNAIRLHVMPYKPFRNIRISELTASVIERWKVWAIKQGIGSRSINFAFQAMSVPIRWLYAHGELAADPFRAVHKVKDVPKEKGVLSRTEVQKLFTTHDSDMRIDCLVKLAVLTGMRRGELRGLRWKDIDEEERLIHVQNNFQDMEGSKDCKCGSARYVVLPSVIVPLLHEVKSFSNCTLPDDFVFYSLSNPRNEPVSAEVIKTGFTRLLSEAGISRTEQKERNITLHGMRHTFITLARYAGLPDAEVMALAGHKSVTMMQHYTHAAQIIDFKEAGRKLAVAEGLTAAGGSV